MQQPPPRPAELCWFRSFAAPYKEGKDEPECEDWRYEREWRVIRSLLSPGSPSASLLVEWDGEVALADPTAVKSLTLGARMPDAAKLRLIHWVREYTPHVEVWQARPHRSKYIVERDRIA